MPEQGGRKIVIEVKDRNPWGDSFDAAKHGGDAPQSITYVPGYSDKRTAFERAKADGEEATPLGFRLQWAAAERPDGSADGRKVADWRRKGYEKLTPDKAKELGVDVAAFQKGQGGEIRNFESVLMWAPAKVAATRYRANQEAINSQYAAALAARGVSQDSPVFDMEVVQQNKKVK